MGGGRMVGPQERSLETSVITSFGHRHHCRVPWVTTKPCYFKVRLIPAPPKS